MERCKWLAGILMVLKTCLYHHQQHWIQMNRVSSIHRLVDHGNSLPYFSGSYAPSISCFLTLLVGLFLVTSIHPLWAQSIQVSMQITVDNRHRVFLGSVSGVRDIVATDWEWHWTGWWSVETYHFTASPGDYIYVVGQDDGGAAMLLSIVRFGDIVVYSGVPNNDANWEVASNYRQRYGEVPPDAGEVNGWIAEKKWEMPAVGAEAGHYWSHFSAYRPARYIWKQPGGNPNPWAFPGGYTGPGTALFRIRVPGPSRSYLRFDVTDAETKNGIGGVLLVLTAYDGSEQIAVETASDGIATIPIDTARLGKTYSLQIFPRRYYRRSDGSVVTYLTPTAGSTGGGTDIAIQIADDGTCITLVDEDTTYHWGDVYWRLTTGQPANTKVAASEGVIRLPMSLIPVKLEKITGTDAVQYSLDQIVAQVTGYNEQYKTKRVPPHVAYANCMLEIGGEPGLAYTEFQGEYWTTVNNRGVHPYPHAHYSGLTNCAEEHTDSGFGYGQLTGLTALRFICSAERWKMLLSQGLEGARTTARDGLSGLAAAKGNIYTMLDILNNGYNGGKLNRPQLAAWKSAIQAYNPGDVGRPCRAWGWLTSSPPQNGTIKWQIPIPSEKYKVKWDASLEDANYDGQIDKLPTPPPPPVVID